jgi:hypothetical protein
MGDQSTDPTCALCGNPDSRHAQISRECPLPYGGFSPVGVKAERTFVAIADVQDEAEIGGGGDEA